MGEGERLKPTREARKKANITLGAGGDLEGEIYSL